MWRRGSFQENPDSDQSISEEEDFADDFGLNCVSLGDRLEIEKEEGLQLQSRLESLKEKCDNNRSYNQEHTNFCLEEDVEVPDSPDEGECFLSRKICARVLNEELVSDGEENVMHSKFSVASGAQHGYGSEEQDVGNVWSLITKEAGAIIHLEKNASSSSLPFPCSKAKKPCKGAKSKMRPRFSFGFQLHKGGSCPAVSNYESDVSVEASEVPEASNTNNHGSADKSITEFLEDFNQIEEKQLDVVPGGGEVIGHRFNEHSMAELLDNLQDNPSLLGGNSKMHSKARGKRVQAALKRSACSLSDRTIKIHEPFSSGSSSNDEEADYQNLELAIPEIKKQTISDKFQEALGTTSLTDEGAFVSRHKVFSIGLFGKLQQVMQCEKDTDAYFLKKLQNGASLKNEPSCMAVEILSRYLDAKLTVCYCKFVKIIEPQTPKILKNEGRKGIVIFNQRICSNVDLEVGNLICIHPPWKEVDVMGSEKIILSTYFADIST